MDHDHQSHKSPLSHTIFNWTLTAFLFVGGYLLILEHRVHLGGFVHFLPFLLLLACSLMHLFMHHGHHRHGQHSSKKIAEET